MSFIHSLRMLIFFTVLTGVAYPLAVTSVGHVLWKENSEGSLITLNGKVVGSKLLAQKFTQPKYFWPRPSAVDYNLLPSGGSNLSPSSSQLKMQVAERAKAFAGATDIPQDLLFASGSGLDPEISPQAAQFQVTRVAQSRNLDPQQVRQLVQRSIEPRQWGFLGESRVNVLQLNLALDDLP